MPAGIIPSPAYNDQIKRVVKQVLREDRGPDASAGTTAERKIRRHQGILLNNVSGSVAPLTSPSFGTVRVVKKNSSGDLVVTNLCLTVAYRFTVPDLEAGSFCKVEFIDGEWSFYAVDCEDSGLPTAGCS